MLTGLSRIRRHCEIFSEQRLVDVQQESKYAAKPQSQALFFYPDDDLHVLLKAFLNWAVLDKKSSAERGKLNHNVEERFRRDFERSFGDAFAHFRGGDWSERDPIVMRWDFSALMHPDKNRFISHVGFNYMYE